jgi:enediyne biosynthesis protein E4
MRLKISVLALLAWNMPSLAEPSLTIPTYVEDTKAAGIHSVYAGEWQYMVGGGVATFDCNADGFPDMLLAGGSAKAKFYQNTSKQGGALHFKAATSGLEIDKVTGAYPLDVDGDGIQDVVLLRVGENIVMRGRGHCKFANANKAWGFEGGDGWSTALAATWEKGNSWPTLAVGNYIDRKQEAFPWGSCTDNWLHRPDASQKKFATAQVLKPSFCALSMLFTDWNKSGTPALRVANDREYYKGGQEQLWHIDAGQLPALYTDKDGWKPLRIWGMGIASADLKGKGYPDYFMTSMADSRLQTLGEIPVDGKPKPSYIEAAFPVGVTAQRPYVGTDLRPSTGWHAQFEDVNNDGLSDLFIVKGNVAKMLDFAAKDPNNLLLQGADGKFVEVGDKAGVASTAIGRGGAEPDFNLDGLPDMVVVNRWSTAQVWRNVSKGTGHWLDVQLLQSGANRDGIGAWVEVKRGDKIMRREITVGGGHVSGQSGWIHFGLGDVVASEMRVMWPDGIAGDWQKFDSDKFYVVERGKALTIWKPTK